MVKFVIYTVITGGFDEVKQPLVVDNRFDYILFTDNISSSPIGIWQVRPIPYTNSNTRVVSRYPKVCPEKTLANYEASLYIDGTIQVSSQWVYDRCIILFDSGIEWAGIRHQWRNNVYEEMSAIIGERWVHDYDCVDWYKYIKDDGYKEQDWLFENNIIFRKHTENVRQVDDIWWWSIENQVKRDQFSLMYALWKVPCIKTGLFLPENENAWNNGGHFQYTNHTHHKRVQSWSVREKIRHRCFRMAYGDDASYTLLLDKVCKYNHPKMMMNLWTTCALFRYGHKVVIAMIKCRWHRNS